MSRAFFDSVDEDALRRRRTKKWAQLSPDALGAWVAEMDFRLAPAVLAAIEASVGREDFGYPLRDRSELAIACCEFLKNLGGWRLDPGMIHAVPDTLDGISRVLRYLTPSHDTVVVFSPAYPPLFDVIRFSGRRTRSVPLLPTAAGYEVDFDRLEHAFTEFPGATLLLCNPHNPTGKVFTSAELEAICHIVSRYGGRVISDDVHAPLVFQGSTYTPYASISTDAADHCVTVISASKGWNISGLKCAQLIVTSKFDVQRVSALPESGLGRVSPLGMNANIAAYRSGATWLRALLAYLERNRDHLVCRLANEAPLCRLIAPQATYLAWLDFSAFEFVDAAAALEERGRVVLTRGSPFGGGFKGFARLNFATSRTMLDAILDRVIRVLADEQPPGQSRAISPRDSEGS